LFFLSLDIAKWRVQKIINEDDARRSTTRTARSCRVRARRPSSMPFVTRSPAIVWATINTRDPVLRRAVEGPYFDPAASDPVPPLSTYPQAIDAEQMVGIVGIRNAFAAYLLGEVRLIGG
jgi:hypothetical protein